MSRHVDATPDTIRLRAERLRLKSHEYDSSAALPTFAGALREICALPESHSEVLTLWDMGVRFGRGRHLRPAVPATWEVPAS